MTLLLLLHLETVVRPTGGCKEVCGTSNLTRANTPQRKLTLQKRGVEGTPKERDNLKTQKTTKDVDDSTGQRGFGTP